MEESSVTHVRDQVDAIYRSESRRVLATLIRLLDDFDLAEEALHDAFAAAVEQWQTDGIPANPRAWLVSTGRFKAIDRLRRSARFEDVDSSMIDRIEATPDLPRDDDELEDDRLRLIFTCCHPALSADARIALTLREVCGLTTEEVAHAFLTPPSTRRVRSEEHTSELQSRFDLVCRLLLEKKKNQERNITYDDIH